MIKLNTKDFVNALKFSIVTAAKKDVRYYFNAVCLEVNSDHVVVVSTDGHRISSVRLNVFVDEVLHGKQLLLNRVDVVRVIQTLDVKGTNDEDVTELMVEENIVTFVDEYSKVSLEMVDGRFPDWRRATSKRATGGEEVTEIAFDWGYLADIGKAFKHVQGGKAKPAKFEFDSYDNAVKITMGTGSVKSFGQLADPTMYLAPMRS